MTLVDELSDPDLSNDNVLKRLYKHCGGHTEEYRILLPCVGCARRIKAVELNAQKTKTEFILELAEELAEDVGIERERISRIIIERLEGIVSESLVRSTLGEEYKDKKRSENARKRRKNEKLAATLLQKDPSLIAQKIILVGSDGHSTAEPSSEQNDKPRMISNPGYSKHGVVLPFVIKKSNVQRFIHDLSSASLTCRKRCYLFTDGEGGIRVMSDTLPVGNWSTYSGKVVTENMISEWNV